MKRRASWSDKVFDCVNLIVMLLLLVIFFWPLWFTVIASVSDPGALHAGQIVLWPKGFSLEGYKYILEYKSIWTGYKNTVIVAVVGTAMSMVGSICLAYPLSDKSFKLRKPLTVFFMFTMYFSGGLVPHYLLYRDMGILDTRLALIFPGLISVYNSLILRAYFQNSIPGELKEAATIDGANAAQYLFSVVLPLSKPVFAVVGLYYFVSYWNNYTNSLYYIYDNKLMPLQAVLRRILMMGKLFEEMEGQFAGSEDAMEQLLETAQLMQYGIIIAAALPVLLIYPFVQKFFVKGVMVGAVKG